MKNIFYGWYVVVALIIVGVVASCVRYMLPVYVPSFLQDFGWTRTTIGFAFTLNFWVASAGGPLIGLLIDKVGGRFVTTIGGISLLSGMVLLSYTTNIIEFYIYYGLIAGLGICCTFYVPISSIARKWFIKKAGLAVSIVLTGAGLGLAIGPPIVSALIDAFGWRKSLIIFGVPSGILSIIVAGTIIRNYPESMGLLPDGRRLRDRSGLIGDGDEIDKYMQGLKEQSYNVKEAVSTPSFWLLTLAYGLSLLGTVATLTHMVTWAQDIKVERGSAALALFVAGICSVLSRIGGGLITDHFGKKMAIYISMIGLFGISLYALIVREVTSLIIFSACLGIFYGLNLPAWTPLLGDLFGRKSLGSLMGFLSLSFGCISGSGPAIFGWIYDKFGTYNLGFVFGAICCIVTLVLVSFIKPLGNTC